LTGHAERQAAELADDELADVGLAITALDPEDAKLVTLARGARGRAGAAEGAAVRDDDGRTYAAATVALPSLTLTALQAAVAMAVASGAQELEAAVVVGASPEIDAASRAAAADLGTGLLILAGTDGAARQRIHLAGDR
jgi:hypothetical protein